METIKLTPRQIKMLEMRFRDNYTLKKISEYFGITQEKVRQNINRTLKIIVKPYIRP